MSLDFSCPFDHDRLPPREPTLSKWRPSLRRLCADLSFIVIKASAFLAVIYLVVLALPLACLLLMTGGDWTLLFTQLGNLSAHFLAASHERQQDFSSTLTLAFIALTTLVVLWRLPSFLTEVSDSLAAPKDAP
jgi:hypothetical protein